MSHPLALFLSNDALVVTHRPVLDLLAQLQIPHPPSAAIIFEQIGYRAGKSGAPVRYTPEDAWHEAYVSDSTFRRVVAILKGAGLLLVDRDTEGALYDVDGGRLAAMLGGDWAGTGEVARVSEVAKVKPAKTDHTELAQNILDAYNHYRGKLPEARFTPKRAQRVGKLVKDFPDVNLPEAIGIATLVVSTNQHYLQNGYGYDNLIAGDNWVKYWEGNRARRSTPERRTGLSMPE